MFVRMTHDWEALFGSRIREMRAARGWTQDELARRMTEAGHPMHQTTVAKLENGNRPTSVSEVGALATLFGVAIGSLFGDPQRVAKQMRLKALEYRMTSLTVEAEELVVKLDAIKQRQSELVAELETAAMDYEVAELEFQQLYGPGNQGGK